MRRKETTTALWLSLLFPVIVSCGPPGGYQRLTVKEGYTTPQVIASFDRRYDVADRKGQPGTVRIEGRDDKSYASISQAVADAPRDAVILVGEGTYRESVVVTDKRLQIRGVGAGKSIILARETALFVSRAQVAVTGIGFWTLTVGSDVSAVALSEATVQISDCRISGATGPGLIAAGKGSRITLTGNLITGNMAGGVRVQGGDVRLLRNLVVRNAQGGLVLAPGAPGSISRLSLWHDTVLDNWSGRRCVSFSKLGVVPVKPLDNFHIEASILNSGGLGETFSETYFGTVKSQGRNFLTASAVPAPNFFVDAAADDYRPRALLKTDEVGFELGALPSPAGSRKLDTLLNNALVSEKLQLAYMASLFVEPTRRQEVHQRIRQVLNNWVGDYLKYKRLGVRLFAALGLARVAPDHWRMEVILDRFLEGFRQTYTFALKPINFFPENPSLGQKILGELEGKTSYFPRFVTAASQSPQAYVLSGRVKKPFVETTGKRPFVRRKTVTNPYYEKVNSAYKMLESRLVEQDKKIEDIVFTINNPHFNHAKKNSRYRRTLEAKKARLVAERVRLAAQMVELEKQVAEATPEFEIGVLGEVQDTDVSGEVFATFVLAPSGDILLDSSIPLTFTTTTINIEAIPEFGFDGTQIVDDAGEVETLTARYLTDQMLQSMIRLETARLRTLLEAFREGTIDSTQEDKLVDLLLLNAHLYRTALASQEEYRQLKAKLGETSEALRIAIGYDAAKGAGKQGVTIKVIYDDEARARRRLQELETIYKPYWELQLLVAHFIQTRFGITEKLFFQTRDVFEGLVGKTTAR